MISHAFDVEKITNLRLGRWEDIPKSECFISGTSYNGLKAEAIIKDMTYTQNKIMNEHKF